MSLYKVQ